MNLGDKVTFTATLQRRQKASDYGTHKYWHRADCAPQTGILIGRRMLSNGKRVWDGNEEGFSYRPTEQVRAALVAFALHRAPVLVPLDALEVTE